MRKILFIIIILCMGLSSCYDGLNDAYDAGDETDKIYAVGDTGPGGGIVFYITNGGLHGMEYAPKSWNGGSDPSIAWGDTTTSVTTSTDIGTGSTNTDAIKTALGSTGAAAKTCRDYTGGGCSDWFLPSKDELQKLYDNIISKDTSGNFAGFNSGCRYWSSSQRYTSTAYNIYINNGVMADYSKAFSSSYCVRPVRAF